MDLSESEQSLAGDWIPARLLVRSLASRLGRFGKLCWPPAVFYGVMHGAFVVSDNLVRRSEHLDLTVAKP